MNIVAIIGSESHSTSSGWAKLKINGRPVSYRDAKSKEFLTEFKDKHASWCECVFVVNPGDTISWEAGTNSGNRGANRERLNLEYEADTNCEVIETPDLGYPAKGAILKGRLRPVADRIQDAADAHEAAKKQL